MRVHNIKMCIHQKVVASSLLRFIKYALKYIIHVCVCVVHIDTEIYYKFIPRRIFQYVTLVLVVEWKLGPIM